MSHEFNIEGRDLTEGCQICSRAAEVRILVIPSCSRVFDWKRACFHLCAFICVLSSGFISECHWNLISYIYKDIQKSPGKAVSLKLTQTIQPFIGIAFLTSIVLFVMFHTSFIVAVWGFLLLDVLSFFYFHAWSGSGTNAQNCEDPTAWTALPKIPSL